MITVAELLKAKELDKSQKQKQIKPKPKPPKSYLNQEEKKEVIITAAFVGEWQKFIEKWQELGRPKEQIKYAKTAITYIFKTMDCIMLHLPDSEKMKVIRKAGQSKINFEGEI